MAGRVIVTLLCPICQGGENNEVTIEAQIGGSSPRDCDVLRMDECFNGCVLSDEMWAELAQRAIDEAVTR